MEECRNYYNYESRPAWEADSSPVPEKKNICLLGITQIAQLQ